MKRCLKLLVVEAGLLLREMLTHRVCLFKKGLCTRVEHYIHGKTIAELQFSNTKKE